MTSTLLIVQIALALAITIAVLLQKSSSIGLGAYSGSNESLFGAKGPMGALAKITFTLALLFIVNTLVLGYQYTQENSKTVVDKIQSIVPSSAEKPVEQAPTAPTTTIPDKTVTLKSGDTTQAPKAIEVNTTKTVATPPQAVEAKVEANTSVAPQGVETNTTKTVVEVKAEANTSTTPQKVETNTTK